MTHETPECPYCGSKEVRRDATSTWDDKAQEWVLLATYDSAWCSDCEEDIKSLKWVPKTLQEENTQ